MRPLLFVLMVGSLLLSGYLIYTVYEKTGQLTRKERQSATTLLFSDELRNDSRILTGITRGLVVAGSDPEQEALIQRIHEERRGTISRRNQSAVAPGLKASFESILQSLDITPEEKRILEHAFRKSVALAAHEMHALRLSQGLLPDSMGNFTVKVNPDKEKAVAMLFDKDYRRRNAEINETINAFARKVSQRVSLEAAAIHNHVNHLLVGVGLCTFVVLVAFTVLSLHNRHVDLLNNRMILFYILTMCILLLAVGGPATLVYFDAGRVITSSMESRQGLVAREIQQELDNRISHLLDVLRIAATQPAVNEAIVQQSALAVEKAGNILETFNNGYADSAELLLLNKEGMVLKHALMPRAAQRLVQYAEASPLLSEQRMQAIWRGEPQIFSIIGENGADLYVAVPVLCGGRSGVVGGVLLAVMDRYNALSFWQGRLSLEEQMSVVVLDENGKVVSSSRDSDVPGKSPLSSTLEDFVRHGGVGPLRYNDLGDGSQRMAYVLSMQEPTWRVAVAGNFEIVNKQTSDIMVRALFFGMAAVLVAIAVISLLLQYLTNNLRRSMERAKNIIEGVGMFTWEYDVRTATFSHNAQWMRLLEMSETPSAGSVPIAAIMERTHLEDVHYLSELRGRIGKDNYVNFEMRLRTETNHWCWFAMMGRIEEVDSYGATLRIAGTGHDITARKMAEISEVEQKQKLEELVEQRTSELVESRNQAEAASRAKSAFLSTVSHEIRTPMNAIVGFTHLFDKSNLTQSQLEYLRKIKLSSDTLLNIINDVLDISKIESGKLELEHEPFHMQYLLDSVRSIAEYAALEKQLKLDINVSPHVPHTLMGDPKRITQIFLNLLNNAIKFTYHGGITLHVDIHNHQMSPNNAAGRATIMLNSSVTDSGIGLTPEQIQRLFQPFSQADSSVTRRFGGTGLGLAICKQLIEMMGGTIGVMSEPNVGSTFHFTLFLEIAEDADKDRRPWDSQSTIVPLSEDLGTVLAGKRVLLVEDNAINQEIACLVLEKVGMLIDTANNGQEALNKAAQEEYHLILMDMQMPVMGGVEATEKLRRMGLERPWLALVPIIAMTANAMAEDKDLCHSAGMNDHLAKPFEPAALYAMLLRWLA